MTQNCNIPLCMLCMYMCLVALEFWQEVLEILRLGSHMVLIVASNKWSLDIESLRRYFFKTQANILPTSLFPVLKDEGSCVKLGRLSAHHEGHPKRFKSFPLGQALRLDPFKCSEKAAFCICVIKPSPTRLSRDQARVFQWLLGSPVKLDRHFTCETPRTKELGGTKRICSTTTWCKWRSDNAFMVI